MGVPDGVSRRVGDQVGQRLAEMVLVAGHHYRGGSVQGDGSSQQQQVLDEVGHPSRPLLDPSQDGLQLDPILAHVWGYTFEGNASVLETFISSLRHKIDHVEPPLIHTVRGVGYSLRLPPGHQG